MKTFLPACFVLLAGCASSTGVIPMGQDTFMVSYQNNGPGASLGALKASALQDAKAHCGANQKDFEVVLTQDVPRSFGQMPEAALQFRCVPRT
jgi:hypothetical protein